MSGCVKSRWDVELMSHFGVCHLQLVIYTSSAVANFFSGETGTGETLSNLHGIFVVLRRLCECVRLAVRVRKN